MKERDFIQLSLGEAGRDPERLRNLLNAQMLYEHMRTRRRRLVALLAIGGACLWLSAFVPVPPSVRSVGLALWVVCFPITIVAAVREYRSFKAREQLLHESQKPP